MRWMSLLLLACLSSGCALLSRASWARASDGMGERRRLGVGEEYTVRLTFPSGGEDTSPPHVEVTCQGADCKVSDPELTLTPGEDDVMQVGIELLSPGELTIDVVMKADGTRQSWRYGPFLVLLPDHLATSCRVTRAGVQRPCEDGMAPGDSVRVEFGVYADTQRFLHKRLVVDAPAPWSCALSAAGDDGLGPVYACTASRLPARSHHVLRARLGALDVSRELEVGE